MLCETVGGFALTSQRETSTVNIADGPRSFPSSRALPGLTGEPIWIWFLASRASNSSPGTTNVPWAARATASICENSWEHSPPPGPITTRFPANKWPRLAGWVSLTFSFFSAWAKGANEKHPISKATGVMGRAHISRFLQQHAERNQLHSIRTITSLMARSRKSWLYHNPGTITI